MTKSKPAPNDSSTVPDEIMRPWTIDEALDKKIQDAIIDLDTTITMKSPQAAIKGKSELDKTPKEYKEFLDYIVQNPNWIDEFEIDDDQLSVLEALAAKGFKIIPPSETGTEASEVDNRSVNNDFSDNRSDDASLMNTILDLNKVLKKTKSNKPRKKHFFRLTGTKDEKKPDLTTIKYREKNGPAILNVSAAEFKRFLSKHGLSSLLGTKDNKRTMPSESELSQLASLNPEKQYELWSKAKFDLLEQDNSQVPTTTTTITTTGTETKLSAVPESEEVVDSNSNIGIKLPSSPIKDVRPSSSQGVSPIKSPVPTLATTDRPSTASALPSPSARGGNLSSPILTLSKSASSPMIVNHGGNLPPMLSPKQLNELKVLENNPLLSPKARPSTVSGGRSVCTPNSARGSGGLNKSASESRFDAARVGSPALSRLSVTNASTTLSSPTKVFVKNRIMEVRSLRDQLMTTNGSLAMNVHPEANPDTQAETLASLALTKRLGMQTMERNRQDQTWTILSTPGFLEAVGADKVFKSDTHIMHSTNEAFEKAVRQADCSQGIQKDAIRIWSESAVKQKIKLFVSGGAMKI